MRLMLNVLRRLFVPRHSNNHRAKIIQPAGLLVLMGIYLIWSTWIKLATKTPLPQGVVLGYASSIEATQVINETNAERAKADLPPLIHNALLTQAATAKAAHMFKEDYWAHVAPDGTTPWFFFKQAGYAYAVAGENLARDFGDTETMIKAWMDSPTHKENMINPKYQEIGVAVVNGKLQGMETTLVVQLFGKPTKAVASAVTSNSASTQTPIMEIKGASSQPTQIISPLRMAKAMATSIMMMLIGVLIYDEYLIHKHKIPRRVGKNWAHLTLFGIALMMIVNMVPGKVL
jgi:hypothetical protein